MRTPISLAVLLERFFTQRLMQQRQPVDRPRKVKDYSDGSGNWSCVGLRGGPRGYFGIAVDTRTAT